MAPWVAHVRRSSQWAVLALELRQYAGRCPLLEAEVLREPHHGHHHQGRGAVSEWARQAGDQTAERAYPNDGAEEEGKNQRMLPKWPLHRKEHKRHRQTHDTCPKKTL